jgi:hypothetical protein
LPPAVLRGSFLGCFRCAHRGSAGSRTRRSGLPSAGWQVRLGYRGGVRHEYTQNQGRNKKQRGPNFSRAEPNEYVEIATGGHSNSSSA